MSSADAEHKSKLEEQAKGKADLSYSYFLAKTATAEAPSPRKLSEAEVLVQQEAERQNKEQGGSLWNHAGTFEERSATPWAKERLTELLKAFSSGGVAVTAVSSIVGDANIWMVRGKKRHGFAFEISLAWSFTADSGAEIKGAVSIPNADVEDIDDLTLAATVEAPHTAGREGDEVLALARVRSLKGPLEKLMQSFYEELKEK